MLERMQRKGNPSALLVGMQTGEATMENNMEFPQKTKNASKFILKLCALQPLKIQNALMGGFRISNRLQLSLCECIL